MLTTLCLMSCALTFGQATDRAEWQLTPQLTPGLELVYQGTYTDEILGANVQRQRQFRLETTLLVLASGAKEWNVALLTALGMQDPRQPIDKKNPQGPMSVRLEMNKVDFQGRVHSADKKSTPIPLKEPPTLEHGFLLAAPIVKVGRNVAWEVGEPGRPFQRWQIVGTESCNGITCIKVTGVQQTGDWDRSRADQSSWRRSDTLWILPQMNVAQKVERIIEWRDPARDLPTRRTVVRYELESKLRYPGSLFDDRKQEILKAKRFYDDAEPLVKQPVHFRPQIETMIQRITKHLDLPTSTHYRNAFLHVRSMLEHARKGESLVPHVAEDPVSDSVQPLAIGQRAPDFTVSSFTQDQSARLHDLQGKPVLILFYNPATPTGKEVIAYAKQLSEKHPESVAIMAMAVTQDVEGARKQHREMRLRFPILDGNGMRLTFGADQTPRLVLLDENGYVRMAQTGWGYQTPYEIQDELRRRGK